MSNTIIQIKRSESTGVPTDGYLANGEFAYSYESQTLFLGNTEGTGIVNIGGQRYVELLEWTVLHANAAFDSANTAEPQVIEAAFDQANTAFALAQDAFGQGNTAFALAQDAFNAANNASDTWVRGHANAAFDQANTAFNTGKGAFDLANTALQLTGGTISGDLIVEGDVTFTGTTTYANTQHLEIGDNIIVLNADQGPTTLPSQDAGIEINRGELINVFITWDESEDYWALTGNTYGLRRIATNTDISLLSVDIGNAFDQANTADTNATEALTRSSNAFGQANIAFSLAQDAFGQANTGFDLAQVAFGAANTAQSDATEALTRSIDAFDTANSAVSLGQDAFEKANLAAGFANDASTISTGTLSVLYGGTGLNSVTTNGILYGQGTSAMAVAAAGTEGKIFQSGSDGVPFFGDVDGGEF